MYESKCKTRNQIRNKITSLIILKSKYYNVKTKFNIVIFGKNLEPIILIESWETETFFYWKIEKNFIINIK